MRKHSERWTGRVAIQSLVALLLALVLAGTGIGCGGDDEDSPQGQAKALMPASAIGMVHIDMAKVRDEIIAAAEKNKEDLKEMPVEPALEVLKKIDAVDIYLLPSGKEPMPVIAIRGPLGPDDVTTLLGKTMGPDAKLIEGKNGRYTVEGPPVIMIVGDEADDVPKGVILAGLAPMLTPEFVGALGKDNATIAGMMDKIDTNAQIWGCVDIAATGSPGKNAPDQMYGSINITGANPLNVGFVFSDEAKADEMIKEFADAPPVIKEMIALKKDGTTVAMTMIGEGSLIDNAVKAFKGMMQGVVKEAPEPE